MNILLFGGSFNPPHLGHEIVIRQAFELIPDIDELWLLPTYNHSFGKDLAPAPHRLTMCNLVIQNIVMQESQIIIKVCDLEIQTKSTGSTYESLQLLKQKYPNHTFSFLMGSDQLPSFDKWEDYQQLLNQMHFYVYPRGSHRHPITYPNMELLESPTQVITNISSTLIRNRIKHHLPIDHITAKTVFAHIKESRLYDYGL